MSDTITEIIQSAITEIVRLSIWLIPIVGVIALFGFLSLGAYFVSQRKSGRRNYSFSSEG
jgi:hypothetical protein